MNTHSASLPRVLVVQTAALGYNLVEQYPDLFAKLGMPLRPMTPSFPAVTCTAQATFRTAMPTEEHGMVCNGFFDRSLRKPFFWEQSAALLPAKRIWDEFREHGGTVGEICVQQSLGDSADVVLSPAPIHKHSGGIIQNCYTKPRSLYDDLCHNVGGSFNLFHYWGPFASYKSTQWITDATLALLSSIDYCPEVLYVYLPHLDYGQQKHGPQDSKYLRKDVTFLVDQLLRLFEAAHSKGYKVLLWGDYAMTDADTPLFPNRILRDAGLFSIRDIASREYPDLYDTPAFALADHQVAHVYINDAGTFSAVRDCFTATDDIESVIETGDDHHPATGDLILIARPGAWFSYKWWHDNNRAPDYASHMDIHNKIGFDPCELYSGFPPSRVSMDDRKVKGTHGRTDTPTTFATDIDFPHERIDNQFDLAQAVEAYLSDEL